MPLCPEAFEAINIDDPFFESLKMDYAEFPTWFSRKASAGETAYVFRNDTGAIEGFLYLKPEDGPLTDVEPNLPAARRLKIGTLKINAHGTRLGERFVRKVFDHALSDAVNEVYVTVFERHAGLVTILQRYGFTPVGTKRTSNGTELVLLKRLLDEGSDLLDRYPLIKLGSNRAYLLSIYPQWHTRLLPDSILRNERNAFAELVRDVSHTNSIHKVYLARMSGMEHLCPGDVLLIYRTTDNQGPAHYRSVATSLCVVEEYRNLRSFASREDFLQYTRSYSVFEESELEDFWNTGRFPHVIRFTYNFALPRRVTRGHMIDNLGFNGEDYWGFMPLTVAQLRSVLAAGNLDAHYVVD